VDRATEAQVGANDLPAWWEAMGRPGWVSDAAQITAFPWTIAGHVRGAWSMDEPRRAPHGRPFPGVVLAPAPLASYDSTNVAGSTSGEARSLDAALAEGRGLPDRGLQTRARSVVSLASASHGLEDNLVTFERGDSSGWTRAEASSATRGAFGGWELVSRHRWGLGLGVTRGPHGIEGTYAQKGGAAQLSGGDEQSSRGESGYAQYRYRAGGFTGTLHASRAYDVHESFQLLANYSRRDAQENRVLADLELARGPGRYVAALEWRQVRVVRTSADAFTAEDGALWGKVGWTHPAGEGVLTLEVAGGERPGQTGFQAAPAVRFAFGGDAVEGRLVVERMLESVWTDLAAGQSAFLQKTWVGGMELGVGQSSTAGVSGTGLHASFRVGHTEDRAVVARFPIEELWLRSGFHADPRGYVFGLLTARASWESRHADAGVEAFALARDRSPAQVLVDPANGFRSYAGWRSSAFGGDLQILARGLVEGVGPRESQGASARRLPGYATLGASAAFTIVDAVITVSFSNLENKQREQVWIDPATGIEALGPPREFRLRLTWKLFG
jgi:hypothetical protein